jgi:hypothetical protein
MWGAGKMSRTPKTPRVGLRARIAGWFKSFTGILASLATIAAAVAGIIASHQTTVVHQQSQVIVNLTLKNKQLQSASASAGAVPTPSTGAAGGTSLSPAGYLSALQPTVDHAEVQSGQQAMSARPYPNSITFGCDGPQGGGQPEDEAYDIAGNTLFTATVGIPDNAADATGLDETVIFASQDGTQLGKPVVVSLGSPARVALDITGVTQLQVTCTGVTEPGRQPDNGNELTLGNAHIS